MAGTLPHAIHIRMRKLHDEEEDARQDKEETTTEKKDRGNAQDKHAQSKAVKLPEAYKPGTHKELQENSREIILSQSRKGEEVIINVGDNDTHAEFNPAQIAYLR